jgi:hypothetical protein
MSVGSHDQTCSRNSDQLESTRYARRSADYAWQLFIAAGAIVVRRFTSVIPFSGLFHPSLPLTGTQHPTLDIHTQPRVHARSYLHRRLPLSTRLPVVPIRTRHFPSDLPPVRHARSRRAASRPSGPPDRPLRTPRWPFMVLGCMG